LSDGLPGGKTAGCPRGALVGRPTDGSKLSGKLLRHGIDVRSARNTALMTLASDLPAPILSKILGIHINTAVDWVSYVKRDWSSYIAARAAPQADLQRDHQADL
jgi:hypothetical protein